MKHPLSRRHLIAGAGSALASLSFPTVWAQAWPQRPIRIVVPFAPGAGTDAVGRLVAEKLAELLPATVVVENRVGASGAIGAQAVAHSAPDGHTLLLVAAPFTTVPAALPGAGYEPLAQFTPLGMIATGPLVWAANKDLPARTLAEVVQLARAKPGFYNYGSAGAGGINHLVLELLKVRTGAFITHIPYRGIAPAVLDMMGGQIHLVTGTVPALAPFIRDGRIKALAVTSDRRTPALPEVPSMMEAGQAGFNVLNYFGLVAPHGTPPEVVGRLNAAIARLVTLPEVKARIALDALEPAAGTPADLGRFLAADLQAWLQVVARQKLQVTAS